MQIKYKQPMDSANTVYMHNSGNSIEKLLRKFKKRVQNSGVLDEYKDRQYFTKPSTKKRIKAKKAKHSVKLN